MPSLAGSPVSPGVPLVNPVGMRMSPYLNKGTYMITNKATNK